MWQKNSEGTTNAPTQTSATASETISALVLVRSRRRLPTRSTVKPFPAIVKMDRIQPRIQNQVPILYWHRTLAGRSSLCLWKKPVWLFYKHLVTFAPYLTNMIYRTSIYYCYVDCRTAKAFRPIRKVVFNYVLAYIWWNLRSTQRKTIFCRLKAPIIKCNKPLCRSVLFRLDSSVTTEVNYSNQKTDKKSELNFVGCPEINERLISKLWKFPSFFGFRRLWMAYI